MASRNLADPSYEPSDEDLIMLSRRAFAGLKEAEQARRVRLRADVARASQEVLRALRERTSPR